MDRLSWILFYHEPDEKNNVDTVRGKNSYSFSLVKKQRPGGIARGLNEFQARALLSDSLTRQPQTEVPLSPLGIPDGPSGTCAYC